MKWIKASERLPEKEGDYFVVYTTGEKMVLYASGTGHHSRWKALVFEWLDETPSHTEGEAVAFAEWDSLFLKEWSIVGMNHYHVKGERFLFVAMTKDGKCITAEGKDDKNIWIELQKKALKK